MNRLTGRLFYVILSGMILIALIIYSAPAVAASPSPKGTIVPAMPSEEPPPTNTHAATATPITGLTFTGWTKGCTSTPKISCDASVVSTHTDPYRWDFDITFTYGDDMTNMGSNFTLNLAFDTGVFYTGVPIWWEMYPITNEVMPNRWIDVVYSGVSDLNPMSYPSGSWTIPSQPSPYDTFRIKFSRVTGTTETLVRTDSWHVTVATYDYHALTPTPTPTAAPTSTPSLTPTSMPTNTPTITPTPNSGGNGTCWISKSSWASYTVYYTIDRNTLPESFGWDSSIQAAAQTWNDVSPSHFEFVESSNSNNIISYEQPLSDPNYLAEVTPHHLTSLFTITEKNTRINPFYTWDTNNTPDPNNPDSNGSTTTYNIQNVMTHEFGHWLQLNHPTDESCNYITMWQYISIGEIKKISLELPDLEAINWQYP